MVADAMKIRNLNVRITGVGSYVPPKVVSNKEVIERGGLDTTDEWISEHAGTKERRVLDDCFGTLTMALEAGKGALVEAGKTAKDIDLIVVGTETSEYRLPAIGAFVRESLGAPDRTPAYDVNAACASFASALVGAALLLHNSQDAKTALVIGSDTMFRIQNPKNRDTAILFGDGAGAVILEKSELPDCLEITIAGSYGASEVYATRSSYFEMDRKLAKGRATDFLIEQVNSLSRKYDFYIFHQASLAVLLRVMEKTGIQNSQTHMTIDKYGNTGAATIPLTLDDALNNGKIKNGDTVVLSALGAGWECIQIAVRWRYTRKSSE